MSTQTPLPHLDGDLPLDAFADDLLARLEAADAPAAARSRRTVQWLAAIAVAACLVGAVLVFASPRGSNPASVLQPGVHFPQTAPLILRNASLASARRPPLGPDQLLRVRMVRTSRVDGKVFTSVWTSWMAADGTARFLVQPSGHDNPVVWSDTRCTPRRCVTRSRDGSKPFVTGRARYGPGGVRAFTAAQLQRLPTDPKALLRAIEARAHAAGNVPGPSGDPWEDGFPLLVSPISPAVRSALFRAFSMLPGVHALGLRRIDGRKGVALARRVSVRPGSPAVALRVIVIDPHTGDLLAAWAFTGRHNVESDHRVYQASVVPVR